jgi:hypothetical protein
MDINEIRDYDNQFNQWHNIIVPRPQEMVNKPQNEDWKYVQWELIYSDYERRYGDGYYPYVIEENKQQDEGDVRDKETFYLDVDNLRWVQQSFVGLHNHVQDTILANRNPSLKNYCKILGLDGNTGNKLIDILNNAVTMAQLAIGIAVQDVKTGTSIFNNSGGQLFPKLGSRGNILYNENHSFD